MEILILSRDKDGQAPIRGLDHRHGFLSSDPLFGSYNTTAYHHTCADHRHVRAEYVHLPAVAGNDDDLF